MPMFSDIENVTISAPGFEDPTDIISLGVSRSWLRTNSDAGRRAPLMQFWPCVVGVVPPVNNIGFHEGHAEFADLVGLRGAHALYRGIERAILTDDKGDDVYVYVSLPEYTYKYVPDLVCCAMRVLALPETVFACYVRRFEAQTESGEIGIILSWEWVISDDQNRRAPKGASERYQTRLWEISDV